ncbi:hypothetical protein PanWU01x14_356790, partial [Parasponia andersonii]
VLQWYLAAETASPFFSLYKPTSYLNLNLLLPSLSLFNTLLSFSNKPLIFTCSACSTAFLKSSHISPQLASISRKNGFQVDKKKKQTLFWILYKEEGKKKIKISDDRRRSRSRRKSGC